MRVLITGADGFVGKNLAMHLAEREGLIITKFTRSDSPTKLPEMVANSDFIFHLAGVNRPEDPAEFQQGNVELTDVLCQAIVKSGRKVPVVYTSSTQVQNDSPYGKSKKAAEHALLKLTTDHGVKVHVCRLPGVFGKWARPNYNSVVATFCHNIARGLPIQVNDPYAIVSLVYIDDVITAFMSVLDAEEEGRPYFEVSPVYRTTVGELSRTLHSFKDSRTNLVIDNVGTGFVRALYSTFLSYLPPESFGYKLQKHTDARGDFVEMLKTRESGQFSYLTAHPGITRGGHYHHSKAEKFLVIRGNAKFRFRNMITNEYYEMVTDGKTPEVVETIPGWTHDISNVGSDELIVMLWANEIFDQDRPDTYKCAVDERK